MPKEVFESIINDRISLLLRKEFGIDSRAERSNKKRPDIICYHKGLLIGMEVSYDRNDAEIDGEKRIREHIADLEIAVWLKEDYNNLPEEKLDDIIRNSKFDIKVLTEMQESLLPFLEQTIKRKSSSAGWFTDIGIYDIKDFIENSIDFLIKEERVKQLTEEVGHQINEFVESISSFDSRGEFAKTYYNLLWRLYGLSLGKDYMEIKEIIFGQVALSILLSSAFYEHARNYNPTLKSLTIALEGDPINNLRKVLGGLLEIDYKTALENTVKILETMPPDIGKQIKKLADLGTRIVAKRILLKRDFAGRIYHEITGDLALRKGFATFYTEIPAAYILTSLTFNEAFKGLDAVNKVKKLERMKVGDFSCGSGTLLTASYYVAERIAAKLRFYDDVDINVKNVGKKILEDGIYGIDALKYAAQITAINLALLSPENLLRQNISTVYLGYVKTSSQTLSWLGSLELLKNGDRFLGLLAWIEDNLGATARVSVSGTEAGFIIPREFDILVMNPPFTRATGRSDKFKERSSFFGFIADKEARNVVKKSYEEVRKMVRQQLLNIAFSEKQLPKFAKNIVKRKDDDLTQYTGIGQAGEGLLFLYLSYKYIKPGGIIGFVLPRNVLAGISWFLIRILLASKFHLTHVIVSTDPNGDHFSESSHIAETLIIAKKLDKNQKLKNDENQENETFFITLMKKPDTALEGIILADRITQSVKEKKSIVYGQNVIINRIGRGKLLEYIDNWNRFVAIADLDLSNKVLQLIEENRIILDQYCFEIKLTRFNNIIKSIGVNRGGDVIEAFNLPVKGNRVDSSKLTDELPGSYPILLGSSENVKRKISVPTNMIGYAMPSSDKANHIISLMSRLFLPNRIRWNTTGTLALYSERPLLANVYFMVRLGTINDSTATLQEKALAIWFASVWGMLIVLINREDTEGAFTRLNTGQWRLLPVLDVTRLNKETLIRLANVFDQFNNVEFRNIHEQFSQDLSEIDTNRLKLDIKFLKALDPDIDEGTAKESLLKFYGRIRQSLEAWIKPV